MSTGTQTATLGESHTLDAAITVAGVYTLEVDTSAAVLGDEVYLEAWSKTISGDTSRMVDQQLVANVQGVPNVVLGPYNVPFEIEFKLRHERGTMTITSMTGTVAVGDTVTGATSTATGIVEWMDDDATPTEIRIRVTSDGTAFQDAENAELDGSNYLVLNDATPASAFKWASTVV